MTTDEGAPLDTLLEVRGKQDKPESMYVAVVSKATKTIRVSDAAGVKAARAFLQTQAKAVAARNAKPKADRPKTAKDKTAVA